MPIPFLKHLASLGHLHLDSIYSSLIYFPIIQGGSVDTRPACTRHILQRLLLRRTSTYRQIAHPSTITHANHCTPIYTPGHVYLTTQHPFPYNSITFAKHSLPKILFTSNTYTKFIEFATFCLIYPQAHKHTCTNYIGFATFYLIETPYIPSACLRMLDTALQARSASQ